MLIDLWRNPVDPISLFVPWFLTGGVLLGLALVPFADFWIASKFFSKFCRKKLMGAQRIWVPAVGTILVSALLGIGWNTPQSPITTVVAMAFLYTFLLLPSIYVIISVLIMRKFSRRDLFSYLYLTLPSLSGVVLSLVLSSLLKFMYFSGPNAQL